jgi:hypothetical protein
MREMTVHFFILTSDVRTNLRNRLKNESEFVVVIDHDISV